MLRGLRASALRRCSGVSRALEVVLVGRPNVGKSTLFNRLVGAGRSHGPLAIVSPVPGTTRDRRVGEASLAGLSFRLTDTGGLDDRGVACTQILTQVSSALTGADVVLLLLDARAGVTSVDKHFAQWLRRLLGTLKAAHVKVHLLANKTEGAQLSDRVLDAVSDCARLGMGEPLLVSATHGEGMADLATVLIEHARRLGLDAGDEATDGPQTDPQSPEDRVIQLAIMGKPNVGKSTLLNAIVGSERVIAGPTPGLTRDAVHVDWAFQGRRFRLVDTAGLTRITPVCKPQSEDAVRLLDEDKRNMARADRNEHMQLDGSRLSHQISLPGVLGLDPSEDASQFSFQISEAALNDALKALRFAQVVLLVVEGVQGKFSPIDLQLANKCLKEGRALVVCANKRDTVSGVTAAQYEEGVRLHCRQYLKEFGEVKVVSCAAVNGDGVDRVLAQVAEVHDSWARRTSTWVLNKWLRDTLVSAAVPREAGKNIVIKFMAQIKTRPPTFALFCNAETIPGFFERFLRSRLQSDFKLEGVPLRFVVRKSVGNPVKKELLRKSVSRRGSGKGEARVGPNRDAKKILGRSKTVVVRDARRRRDSRRKGIKKYTSKTKY